MVTPVTWGGLRWLHSGRADAGQQAPQGQAQSTGTTATAQLLKA